MIVTVDELGSQPLTVTEFAFTAAAGPAEANYANVELYMGHTALSELTATYDNNWSSTPVQVYSNPLVQLGGLVAGELINFPLDSSFEYNGTDNLLVEFVWNGPDESGSLYVFGWIAEGNRVLFEKVHDASTGTLSDEAPYLKIEAFPLSFEQMTFAGIKASF